MGETLTIFEKTYLSLKNLFEENKEAQKQNKDLFIYPLLRAKNLCSIKFYVKKKCGTTTALCRLIKENFKKIIFMDSTDHMPVIFARAVIENASDKIFFCPFEDINRINIFIKEDIDAIILDSSNLLTKKNIDFIYKLCLPLVEKKESFYFIFVLPE